MGHVGKKAALVQDEIDFLDTGVVPFVFEAVAAGRLLRREQVVFGLVRVACRILCIVLGISLAVHGVEGIVAFVVEGHQVVVQETFLAAGSAGPPSQGLSHGAAAEVAVNRGVPYPGLGRPPGYCAHVGRGVERIAVGLIHRECLEDGAGGNAVGVVCLDLNLMLAGLAETEADAVARVGVNLTGLSVNQFGTEIPNRHHPLVLDGERDDVGGLVHIDDDIEI